MEAKYHTLSASGKTSFSPLRTGFSSVRYRSRSASASGPAYPMQKAPAAGAFCRLRHLMRDGQGRGGNGERSGKLEQISPDIKTESAGEPAPAAPAPAAPAPAVPAPAVPASAEPSLADESSYGSKKTGRTIQPSMAARLPITGRPASNAASFGQIIGQNGMSGLNGSSFPPERAQAIKSESAGEPPLAPAKPPPPSNAGPGPSARMSPAAGSAPGGCPAEKSVVKP